jgi:hypothetical protein
MMAPPLLSLILGFGITARTVYCFGDSEQLYGFQGPEPLGFRTKGLYSSLTLT